VNLVKKQSTRKGRQSARNGGRGRQLLPQKNSRGRELKIRRVNATVVKNWTKGKKRFSVLKKRDIEGFELWANRREVALEGEKGEIGECKGGPGDEGGCDKNI